MRVEDSVTEACSFYLEWGTEYTDQKLFLFKSQSLCKNIYLNIIKETEDDPKKSENIPCPWILRINVVKMTRLPKTVYRCNTICIKLSMILFTELEQINLKFIWNHKGPKIIKAILKKKNKLGCITFSRLQTTLQSYSNQASMILVQKQTYGSMEPQK